MNRKNKNNLLQSEDQMEFTKTIIEDDEDVTNIKINKWKW